MKGKWITVFVGAFVAIGSWAPLWIVETNDPQSIPFELGLLTFAVSVIGGVVALIGLIGLVIHASRAARP